VIKTLLIDGNNLLKIGFHGVKDFFHEGKHVGGIWHFLNTTRRFIEEENFDKVVVVKPYHKTSKKNLFQNRKDVLNNILRRCLLDKLTLIITKRMI
jgi:5'-3' exonuclease